MQKPFVEKDCFIEHEGQKFESGGAVVTDEFVIGYMSSDMNKITTWHGETITDSVKVTSSWRIHSYLSDRQYQVKAMIEGRWYTGRTLGNGMIVRLKPCK